SPGRAGRATPARVRVPAPRLASSDWRAGALARRVVRNSRTPCVSPRIYTDFGNDIYSLYMERSTGFAASETTQRVAGSTVLRGTGFDTPRPPPRIRKGWGGKYDDLTKPTK